VDLLVVVKCLEPYSESDTTALRKTLMSPNFPKSIQIETDNLMPRRRGLSTIDPTVVDLIVKVAGGAVATATITGLFRCLGEWLKGRAQIRSVKIGDVEISAPDYRKDNDLITFAQEVVKISSNAKQPRGCNEAGSKSQKGGSDEKS
jgi:hypothetical protein